jgi:energy-coupling factor transport system ATP-binding protein
MAVRGIEVSGVTYRYAGASGAALEDVSLQVKPGSVTGVVGANESGKSTLCLVVAALAPGSIGGRLDGSVVIDGAETRTLKPHEAPQKCGVLFQNPTTQLSGIGETVWEEVAFGPRNLGLPLLEVVARVSWALALVRIEPLAARDPNLLSGGQAQLVALASVLALRPAYLVLDEPTSQLDPFGTRLVGRALLELARETGTGILIVEHKTDLLARLADEVVVLQSGRTVLTGPARRVLSDPRLASLGVEPPSSTRLEHALEAAGANLDRSSAETIAAAVADADRVEAPEHAATAGDPRQES